MIADTFDHCGHSRVADGEAFPGAPGREEAPRDCTVERHVPEQHMLFAVLGGATDRTQDEVCARQSFTHEVIGLAGEDQLHSLACERTEGLTCSSVQIIGHVDFVQLALGAPQREFAGKSRAHCAMLIADVALNRKRLAFGCSSQRWFGPGLVERMVFSGPLIP